MQQIKIDGVSQAQVKFGTKVTFVSGKEKYSFFDKKTDGSNTKAYDQFLKYGFKVGDLVFAEVKEKEESFINKEGKKVNYVQRTILFFQEIDHVPVAEFAKKPEATPSADFTGLLVRLNKLESRVTALEDSSDQPEVVIGYDSETVPF